ncbi:hypothetical protein FS935_07195 [Metabacillus litoralis]|uniref:Uncharacterized protein n=1 Tax=Metabacillus litoralis TaxID=152268 RepID=A0A5C6W8H5_9BACI|nr:hypothetical protein [Metabacillus litoralis]TXC92159.1 hypothetical protein FS935_07195 [Metabacillus litoralis]
MKNKKVNVGIVLLFIVSVLTIASYKGLEYFTSTKAHEKDLAKVTEKSNPDSIDDVSTEIVNEPASKDVVVFSTSEYEDGHDFITDLHEFYNDTLCWGRVNTADYKKQQEKALHIVSIFKEIEVKDEKLYEDFISIENTAKKIIDSDDREAMIKLHRLFHDLDIYFNGYSEDHTFGVTSYKG